MFAGQLNSAIATKAVTPEEFADEFIAQAGPDNVRRIVTGFDPGKLVDVIASAPGGAGTAIVTRDGRVFVRELWDACKERVGG